MSIRGIKDEKNLYALNVYFHSFRMWWLNNPKEATEKYKECKKSGEDSVNCQNVKKVAGIIGRTYGPMLEILKAESAEYDKQHGLNR